jgi:glycosyltransferase involved in cell wall biosynthesis
MKKIAVAMSVYNNDSVSFLEESIESILNQTYKNFELFIQVDGRVRSELRNSLLDYGANQKVHVYFNEDNLGLALRLNNTIDMVMGNPDFSYLARMDADDISELNRFERQMSFMVSNPDIGVVGSDVIEINYIGDEVFYKKMPSSHSELEKNIIKRCPFNHPTVLIDLNVLRKTKLKYKSHLKNTQDYYLWVDMLANNIKFSNINEPLLKFRVDKKFHSRRGIKKAMVEFLSRLYAFKHLDVINVGNVVHTFLLFLLRISPAFVKKAAYKFLR